MVDWDLESGWKKPSIIPYQKIKIPVTATCLHYGIAVHEGISTSMNAETGHPQGFRVETHLKSLVSAS